MFENQNGFFHVSVFSLFETGLGFKRVRLTHTAHSGGVELKINGTVTHVVSWRVHTQAVDAVHGVGAFIDVCRDTHQVSNTHPSDM